ncbi:MAG: efflux RND transporter permease subunit [Thalassovita sp.]
MTGFFVRHPVAANLLMVLMCILGVSVLTSLERETFPEFAADTVGVGVIYPGASARDVDEEICAPLEDALTGVDGLSDLSCLSVEGRASATIELEEGGDITQFFNDVFSAVSGIKDFPDAAETPSVEIANRTDLVALLAISGISGKQGLIEYSDELSDRILALPGVASATVSGVSERELKVTFDEAAMRRFGLSSRDIASAISSRSLQLPLGKAELSETSLLLRYSDARRSVQELEDLIVLQTTAGGIVRLGDLALVQLVDANEDIQSFIDGDRAAIVSISKTKNTDSIRVFDRVKVLLDEERAAYPAPFQISVINDMTEMVQDRVSLILQNIAIGLVLVFATMWLFFSLRQALWISAALPVSFLGTLFLMSVFGITINMITLVALLMAVGLIMDDSIVIAENIDKWRHRVGPVEAAIKGTTEVLPGVLSSFLTTACVFGPLMFLSGEMGQILRFIPMVLLLTLALSLVEGFLILPNHLSHSGDSDTEHKKERPAARALAAFQRAVVLPVATRLVALRYLTVGTVLAALILSISLVASGTIKVIPFPSTESDTIIARVALTSGIDRDRTVQTVDTLLAALKQVDAQRSPNTQTGEPLVQRVLVRYGVNSEVNDNGSNTATITVDLLESALRNAQADDILIDWHKAAGPLPDLVQSSFSQAERGPGGLDLDVELLGRDADQVETAASEVLSVLLARADVTEAFQDFYGGRKEVQLALNEYGLSIGLTPQGLVEQLRNAFAGTETDSFRVGVSNMAVQVELADSVANLTELEQFPIAVGQGQQVALQTVTHMVLAESYPTITRKNGKVVARIQGKIDRGATTSALISKVVTTEIAPELKKKYPDVTMQIGGATQEQNKSQQSALRSLLLGLVGVYLVLAFQFRSYTLPFVVMLSIPFALIGTILGHFALGLDMSMPSFIGFASLAGIVVNNAILFLTFFQTHLKGNDYVSASLDAVRARFRPVLLSTSTTFVGLIPIIAETSPQVQTMVPLVTSVAFGLLASMILIVLVFPSLLSIYFDVFNVRKWVGRFGSEQ